MLFILDYSLISEQMFDKIDSKVLLHIDVNGGSLFAESKNNSSDYIDSSHLRNLGKEIKHMLTITDLIAVISLCVTFYSLGYAHGEHSSRTQK